MTRRTDRRVALLAGGGLAVLFVLCSTMQVASWSIGSVERNASRTIPGPVRVLSIEAVSGDVTIVPATGRDVTIASHTSGAVHLPQLRTEVVSDHVTVSGGCPRLTFGHCSARLIVQVPASTVVKVDATSGDVSASGLSGGADLRTASGDVEATDLGGSVSLDSASGDVVASDLHAGYVRARTASGDVELAFTVAPQSADAETSSGDARILVPHGREGYRVDVHTDSGDPSIGVTQDDGSSRLLRAHTNSGDALVGYGG